MQKSSLLAFLICFTTPVYADPLPDMAGSWNGSGWARQASGGPKESVRCRLQNEYQPDRNRLRVRGQCAVPGRRFDIDGALIAGPDGGVRGFWTNPDGPGQMSISGQIEGQTVYFTFRAEDPSTGQDVSQIVTWLIDVGGLSFRSVARPDREEMSAIDFTR